MKLGILPQIQQRVQFEGGLRRSERRPGKDRQTPIDRRRVERVNRLGQVHAEGPLGIHTPCDNDQAFVEARVDMLVARRVGVGQCVARNVAANLQMIELRRLGSQARLDIPQTLSVRQPSEGHAEILVEAREALDLVLPGITRHASTDVVSGRCRINCEKTSWP